MSTENDKTEMIREARLFYQGAPVILPLIQRRRQHAQDRLLNAFREGKHDLLLTLTAELNAFDLLEREIISKEQTYRTLEEQNAGTNRK